MTGEWVKREWARVRRFRRNRQARAERYEPGPAAPAYAGRHAGSRGFFVTAGARRVILVGIARRAKWGCLPYSVAARRVLRESQEM